MDSDSPGLPSAPDNLDLLLVARTNAKLVAQLSPEVLASVRATQESIARVKNCLDDIHSRLQELHATVNTVDFPLPQAQDDRASERYGAAIQEKFARVISAKTFREVNAAMEESSPVARGAPSIPSLIMERGTPEDVVAYTAVREKFALGEKQLALVAPSWTSWVDAIILWFRGVSLNVLREETRDNVQACAARTKELYLRLLEKPAPAILHTQKAFYRKAKDLFENILAELQALRGHLQDPAVDGRAALTEELDRIQTECAKADRRSAILQHRMDGLETGILEEEAAIEERQQPLPKNERKKKKLNGERTLSRHAGTVQIGEKRRQLSDAKLQKESVDQRQRQLDAEIARYRSRLESFDPLAVNPARVEHAQAAIGKHVQRFNAEWQSSDDAHQSFTRLWQAEYAQTVAETANEAAVNGLVRLHGWSMEVLDMRSRGIDDAVRTIDGNWSILDDAYTTVLNAQAPELHRYLEKWAQELATHLASFDPALRQQIITTISRAVPGMSITPPKPRIYNNSNTTKTVGVKNAVNGAKDMMLEILENAVKKIS